MQVVSFVIVAIIAVLGRAVERRWTNLLTFFSGMWAIVILLSSLRLFGLVEIDEFVYTIILIGNISFVTGYLLYGTIWNRRQLFAYGAGPVNDLDMNRFRAKAFHPKTKKILWVLLAVTLIYYAYNSLVSLRLLLAGKDFIAIRNINQGYADIQLESSGFMHMIRDYVANPCIALIIPAMLISMFLKKVDVPFIVLSLLAVGAYIFSTGGRISLVYIIIDLVFLARASKIRIPGKIKKWIKRGVVAAIVLIAFLTYFRTRRSDGTGIIGSIYRYLVLSMPLLDYHVKSIQLSGDMFYGMAFFLGLIKIIYIVFNRVGLSMPRLFHNTLSAMTLTESTWVRAFPAHKNNAFVTMFYYFYADFRLLGVILGSFVFGYFCCWSYKRMLKKGSIEALFFFLMVVQVVSKSFVRWEFSSLPFDLAVLYYLIGFILVPRVRLKSGRR